MREERDALAARDDADAVSSMFARIYVCLASHMAEREPRNELSREIRMRLFFECKRGADTVNLATNDCSIVRCFTSSQEPEKMHPK